VIRPGVSRDGWGGFVVVGGPRSILTGDLGWDQVESSSHRRATRAGVRGPAVELRLRSGRYRRCGGLRVGPSELCA